MKISVVMSVYNGARTLAATLDSILAQTERNFELIVVDDGSTDATPLLLADYSARDSRIKVITQANTGLTRALIRGCEAAAAPVIARHDAGDLSHPERFREQLALLNGDVVLVACGSTYAGPELEPLYDVIVDPEATRQALLTAPAEQLHGIAGHGSAMFRRDAYKCAGGYREQFYLAQDLDLWVRLAGTGRIAASPQILCTMRVEPGSITTTSHLMQTRLKTIIVALRDHPERSEELLREAASVRPLRKRSRRARAAGLYFIGRMLQRRGDRRGVRYLLKAIGYDPSHVRAWAALFLAMLGK